jgi:glycosyltransferase involved in cell wall biosynthesis
MLARTFIKQSKQVNIITFSMQYPSFLFPGKTQFSSSPPPEDLFIERKINSMNPINWWKTGKYIKKMKPDVLILRYWTPLLAPCFSTICRIVAKNKHTKIIAQLDNVIPHEKHFFDNHLTHYFLNSVDGFLYMSEQVKKDLDFFKTGKPSVHAPHPIFSNFGEKVERADACKHLNLSSEARYVLFFGLIRDYKGLDLILDAWANLKEKGAVEDKKLIVAGEFYTDKEPYIKQIERLNLSDDVILHDHFIPDDEVKYYFSAADFLVQPYKSATQSGVTQIAYQFETPMIVTRVGGLPEIVPNEKIGYVVEPQAIQIAEAIEKIYQNENLQRMSSNMKIEKKRFSWEYLAEQLEELYLKIR